MRIIIINGPNLGRLGKRLPEVYGSGTAQELIRRVRAACPEAEVILEQRNGEGEIIDLIEKYGYCDDVAGIIINPGAYTHYSYAIADAIEAAAVPVVEVHISNIYAREDFRSHSVTARHCAGMISGMGLDGYVLAALHITCIGDRSHS